mmetsp:Transcript_28904/g.74267  ORF Transcript_28904/g.74267 Transcript_28904/m.74267 type:complete len:104 (-) Transcript_28904:386-697(-)
MFGPDPMRPCRYTASRTLSRSYNDEQHLDGGDHEKLQMLETYLSMQAEAGSASAGATEPDADLEMPTRAEDVDKFMAELAAAAAGGPGAGLAPADEGPPSQRI